MPLPEDDPSITPLDELFIYDLHGVPRLARDWHKDINRYRLRICGLVKREMALSLEDVMAHAQVRAIMVLQCMTNVHWGRLRFEGTCLLDLLESAGVQHDAFKIVFRAADGFETSIHLNEIRARPEAFLLAYRMAEQPLTDPHGWPLRLTADGKYGYKWAKWLVEIEAVDYDHKGYYEGKRGWSDLAARGHPVT